MVVYEIRNNQNGMVYIGQTIIDNPRRRFLHHRWKLRSGRHVNSHLQNAWNKYGEDSFSFLLLASARHTIELDQLEVAIIAENQSDNRLFGYNISPGGERHNRVNSPETRAKISNSNKGKVVSAETRLKISQQWKPQSAEVRKRQADSLRGKKYPPNPKRSEGLRRAWVLRRILNPEGFSAEARAKISNSLKEYNARRREAANQ